MKRKCKHKTKDGESAWIYSAFPRKAFHYVCIVCGAERWKGSDAKQGWRWRYRYPCRSTDISTDKSGSNNAAIPLVRKGNRRT